MSTKKKIEIFDTTLRDGEQSPGAAIAPEQKIIIARQLAKAGVDIIEPGFAVSSAGEFAAIQQISRELQQVEIAGFARAVRGDIDAAMQATVDAARRRLHIFISSSDIHLEYQLRKTRAEVVQIAREMVAYGKQFVDEIEFSAMDATRSDPNFVIELVEAVIAEGATIINLPDTLGYTLPHEMKQLFTTVRNGVRGGDRVRYSAHCHDDLGLAVANSLAAIEGGATQIEVTVNGIGERAGNCPLEELIMAIQTRSEALQAETQINQAEIYETSRLVSRTMNFPIAFNKPIVGRNAFQHESGIHQDGLLKNRNTYEIMDPEALGISRSMIVLGKHSGRHALKHRLEDYGIQVEEQQLQTIYEQFKELADQKKIVSDDELLTIAGNISNSNRYPYTLEKLVVTTGTDEKRTAEVMIKNQQQQLISHTASGVGAIAAVVAALKETIHEIEGIEDLEIHSLSTGESAQGEATVNIIHQGKRYRAAVIDEDIVLATAKAYISACNQAILKGNK